MSIVKIPNISEPNESNTADYTVYTSFPSDTVSLSISFDATNSWSYHTRSEINELPLSLFSVSGGKPSSYTYGFNSSIDSISGYKRYGSNTGTHNIWLNKDNYKRLNYKNYSFKL